MNEKCQVCGDVGDDRRTLLLSYFYDLSEISDKFDTIEALTFCDGQTFNIYRLRTCKNCRGRFLDGLSAWINKDPTQEEPKPSANIPVRVNGRIVMMTVSEYQNYINKKEKQ